MADRGTLVLIGTPLGNREDLSPRARRAILGADLLLCEDTRSPVRLLGADAELPPRQSCFVGNEGERVAALLEHLERGETVAFVSEAGLPVWSDPGRLLVAAALDAGFAVDVIPGPTAAAVAVCHSGLAAANVRFVGFPPRDTAPRRALVKSLVRERALVVLYEAGNRVPALLAELAGLPDAATRTVVIARELTKVHQEIVRGPVTEVSERITEPLRGEVTIVLEGTSTEQPDAAEEAARSVLDTVLADLKPRQKARELAKLTGLDARTLYDRLIATKPRPDDE